MDLLEQQQQQQPQPAKSVLDELAQARRELQRRDKAIRKLRQRLDQLESRLEQVGHRLTDPESATEDQAPLAPPAAAPLEAAHAAGVVQWQSLSFDARPGKDEPGELDVEFELETQFFAGLNQDMAHGGVFVATYRVEPVGTALTLRFV